MAEVPRVREGGAVSGDPVTMTYKLCPVCEKRTEDYAPGVSSVTIDGIEYHPSCAAEMSAKYRGQVEAILTEGPDKTRVVDPLGKNPILDEQEFVEMVEAYLNGISARDFAVQLAARDLNEAEQNADPYPGRLFPTAENE